MDHFCAAAAIFEQSPACGEFFDLYQSRGREIKAFAAYALLWLQAKGLGAVGEEIGAGDFALDEHGVAGALPSDGVGHFAADAGLLGEDYSTAVAAEPVNSLLDQLGVSHGFRLPLPLLGLWKQE